MNWTKGQRSRMLTHQYDLNTLWSPVLSLQRMVIWASSWSSLTTQAFSPHPTSISLLLAVLHFYPTSPSHRSITHELDRYTTAMTLGMGTQRRTLLNTVSHIATMSLVCTSIQWMPLQSCWNCYLSIPICRTTLNYVVSSVMYMYLWCWWHFEYLCLKRNVLGLSFTVSSVHETHLSCYHLARNYMLEPSTILTTYASIHMLSACRNSYVNSYVNKLHFG